MEHRITAVEPGGIAEELGIRADDLLLAINGQPVADLIDYQAFIAAPKLRLLTKRGDEELEYSFTKDDWAPLGLSFDRPLMSRQRDCVNRCVFCFVDQLPARARPSLRVKDDDWRMSLMMGNFVTLTNVSDAELRRIVARRVSPLYISVHATDPALRSYLLGNPRGGDIMKQLRALADAGLRFHAQAVLCPGLNDGAALDQTIADLVALYPAAQSLALVPVGLTAHRAGLSDLRPYDRDAARAVLDQAARWRDLCFERFDDPFVHPSDEFYLIAERDFPPDAVYGDYPQIENGVGLCRLFETEFTCAAREGTPAANAPKRRFAAACGTSFAPVLRRVIDSANLPGVIVDIFPLTNGFFGESVTVSGLLTGGDLLAMPKLAGYDALLISATMLREGGDTLLDDTRLPDIEAALGLPVLPVRDGAALYHILSGEMQ